jgi:hypothetical protein
MGLLAHGAFVKKAQPAQQPLAQDLAPKKDVGRHRQVGGDAAVLIKRLDPGVKRVMGRFPDAALAFKEDLAAVGFMRAGQNLDQRGLAGAIVADQTHDLARVQGEVRHCPGRRRRHSAC